MGTIGQTGRNCPAFDTTDNGFDFWRCPCVKNPTSDYGHQQQFEWCGRTHVVIGNRHQDDIWTIDMAMRLNGFTMQDIAAATANVNKLNGVISQL